MPTLEGITLRDTLRLFGTVLLPATALWLLATLVYRRYFHPLSKIPGPFLGSVSELYYFYWQYVRNGSLYLQLGRLTEKYGKYFATPVTPLMSPQHPPILP